MGKFLIDESDYLINKDKKEKTAIEENRKDENQNKVKEKRKVKETKTLQSQNSKEIDLAKIFTQAAEKGGNNPRQSFMVTPLQAEALKAVAYHKRIETGASGIIREALNDYFIKIKKDPVISRRIIEDLENIK